jgi:hypothetical protein
LDVGQRCNRKGSLGSRRLIIFASAPRRLKKKKITTARRESP